MYKDCLLTETMQGICYNYANEAKRREEVHSKLSASEKGPLL